VVAPTPQPPSPAHLSRLLALQQTAGNRATAALLQRKITVGGKSWEPFAAKLDPSLRDVLKELVDDARTFDFHDARDLEAFALGSSTVGPTVTFPDGSPAARAKHERDAVTAFAERAQQAHGLESSVQFGTEFTFTDKTLIPTTAPELKGKETRFQWWERTHKSALDKFQGRWLEWVRGTKPDGPPMAVKIQQDHGKGTLVPPWKVEYSDGDGRVVFWWRLDIDELCFETQTAPATAAQLGSDHIGGIIRSHIFEGAARAGLSVDQSPSGGGGHLSIDLPTGTGGSGVVLLQLLQSLQARISEWRKQFRTQPDLLNNPWLEERKSGKELLARYGQALGALEDGLMKGTLDLPAAGSFLKSFDRSLGEESLKFAPKDRPHYQAVNIEHITESGGSARVELRDINAQKDHTELMTQLHFLLGRIREVSKLAAYRVDAAEHEEAAAAAAAK
jgi:hypothetical protein